MSDKKLSKEEQAEVKELFRQAEQKVEAPRDLDNVLEWGMAQLNAYIKQETKGMSPTKKLKFGRKLVKYINDKKKENKQ